MKALVYHGPGKKALEDRAKPELRAADDAIVKITKTTICGTDLHILKGDVATCAPGLISGAAGLRLFALARLGRAHFPPGHRVVLLLHLAVGKVRIVPPYHVSPSPPGWRVPGKKDRGPPRGFCAAPPCRYEPLFD